MADLKISYADFKSFRGMLPIYYITGADGSYKLFFFPPGGDCDFAVISSSGDIADFEANIKPTATSVTNRADAQATNTSVAGGSITLALPTYVIEAAMAGANNKALIGLLNPAASGKIIKVWAIWVLVPSSSGATVVIPIELRKISALSAGTSVTPLAYDSTDSASVATAAADAPTNTDVALWYTRIYQVNSAQYSQGYWDPTSFSPQMKPITLNAGSGLLLKQVAGNTSTFRAGMAYTEQ